MECFLKQKQKLIKSVLHTKCWAKCARMFRLSLVCVSISSGWRSVSGIHILHFLRSGHFLLWWLGRWRWRWAGCRLWAGLGRSLDRRTTEAPACLPVRLPASRSGYQPVSGSASRPMHRHKNWLKFWVRPEAYENFFVPILGAAGGPGNHSKIKSEKMGISIFLLFFWRPPGPPEIHFFY